MSIIIARSSQQFASQYESMYNQKIYASTKFKNDGDLSYFVKVQSSESLSYNYLIYFLSIGLYLMYLLSIELSINYINVQYISFI